MNGVRPVTAVPETRAGSVSRAWWHSPFRMFQTNLREVDAGLDVERVLDFIQDFGADTWLVNAGGILSFYPTDLSFQVRNPYLAERPGGDLLGDAIAAAHARGVRVIARMDFSKIARKVADEHPEWCFIGPDGRQQVFNGLVSVCPSAPYYQEKTFQILDEVIDRYDVDGFFFNSFGFNEIDYAGRYRGVSQTEASRRGFAEFSGGLELPLGPDSENYNLWRVWSGQLVRDLAARIREHINARHPAAALILRRSADIVFDEANNEVGRELWHHQTAESVSALRTVRPATPVLVNSVSFIDMPYRMAGEQPEHFAQYLIQTIARGGNPSTYIMGVPGDIPYPSLELAAEVTRFHRRHSDVYQGLQPAANVGLMRPDPFALDVEEHRLAVREFRGIYTALQESHIPFDVVPLEEIDELEGSGGIDRYTDLVLPDVGPLREAATKVLDRYVAAGGRLLLTGRSGFDTAGDAQLVATPATAISASTTEEELLKSTYVVDEDAVAGHRVAGPVVPVFGAHYRLVPAPGAEPRMSFLPQASYGPPEKAYGHRPDGVPGYLVGGQGITLIPWTIGRAYHELGLSSIRDHFVSVFQQLRGGGERLTAQLPEHVEITLQRRGADLVVHLLNLSGRKRKSFGAVSPVHGGSLRLSRPAGPVTAQAVVADQHCEVTAGADDVVIHVPQIGRFEVVVINEGSRSS